MEKTYDIQVQLARSNINIIGVTPSMNGDSFIISYEFQYRLPSGAKKWQKTAGFFYKPRLDDALRLVLEETRQLRRELEG